MSNDPRSVASARKQQQWLLMEQLKAEAAAEAQKEQQAKAARVERTVKSALSEGSRPRSTSQEEDAPFDTTGMSPEEIEALIQQHLESQFDELDNTYFGAEVEEFDGDDLNSINMFGEQGKSKEALKQEAANRLAAVERGETVDPVKTRVKSGDVTKQHAFARTIASGPLNPTVRVRADVAQARVTSTSRLINEFARRMGGIRNCLPEFKNVIGDDDPVRLYSLLGISTSTISTAFNALRKAHGEHVFASPISPEVLYRLFTPLGVKIPLRLETLLTDKIKNLATLILAYQERNASVLINSVSNRRFLTQQNELLRSIITAPTVAASPPVSRRPSLRTETPQPPTTYAFVILTSAINTNNDYARYKKINLFSWDTGEYVLCMHGVFFNLSEVNKLLSARKIEPLVAFPQLIEINPQDARLTALSEILAAQLSEFKTVVAAYVDQKEALDKLLIVGRMESRPSMTPVQQVSRWDIQKISDTKEAISLLSDAQRNNLRAAITVIPIASMPKDSADSTLSMRADFVRAVIRSVNKVSHLATVEPAHIVVFLSCYSPQVYEAQLYFAEYILSEGRKASASVKKKLQTSLLEPLAIALKLQEDINYPLPIVSLTIAKLLLAQPKLLIGSASTL